MPIVVIEDTGVLTPAITDLDPNQTYIDTAYVHINSPSNMTCYVLINVNTENLNLLSATDLEILYGVSPIDYQNTVFLRLKFSTSVTIVAYSNENLSIPIISTSNVVVQKTGPWAVITPDPNSFYTEPTKFTITPPEGFTYCIVLNDSFYTTQIPARSYYECAYQNLILHYPAFLTLNKSTKISIFYYIYDIEHKSDEFVITFKTPFNFTVKDYGKVCSFTNNTEVIIEFTEICTIELTIIDLERKLESVQIITIDDNLSLTLSFDSTALISIKSLSPVSLTRKYIFKKESGKKSVYSFYYDDQGSLTSNLLDGKLFNTSSMVGM